MSSLARRTGHRARARGADRRRSWRGHCEIAETLYLSEGTVRNYLSVAIQKLDAHSRVEAARIAEQKGWL